MALHILQIFVILHALNEILMTIFSTGHPLDLTLTLCRRYQQSYSKWSLELSDGKSDNYNVNGTKTSFLRFGITKSDTFSVISERKRSAKNCMIVVFL